MPSRPVPPPPTKFATQPVQLRAAAPAGAKPVAPPPVTWSGIPAAQPKPVPAGIAPPPFAPLRSPPRSAVQAKPATIAQPMKRKNSLRATTVAQSGPKVEPQQTAKRTRANSQSDGTPRPLPVFVAPPACKKKDRFGNKIYLGTRPGWVGGYVEWCQAHLTHACHHHAAPANCVPALQLDHKSPVNALIAANCTAHEVCDGEHHWQAYIAEFDGEDLTDWPIASAGGKTNSVKRALHITANHQWMCQHHNGSKSGRRDADQLHRPTHIEPCPGDTCSYTDPAA